MCYRFPTAAILSRPRPRLSARGRGSPNDAAVGGVRYRRRRAGRNLSRLLLWGALRCVAAALSSRPAWRASPLPRANLLPLSLASAALAQPCALTLDPCARADFRGFLFGCPGWRALRRASHRGGFPPFSPRFPSPCARLLRRARTLAFPPIVRACFAARAHNARSRRTGEFVSAADRGRWARHSIERAKTI